MKTVLKFGLVLWILSSSLKASSPSECPQGIDAFKATVHAKVSKNCMECHNGSDPDAPAFATSDIHQSYFRLLNYTNFQQPQLSTLVVRAGNNHCKKENCNAQVGSEMLNLVKQWWEDGQKNCPLDGHYFTTELSVPMDLPLHPAGYKKLEWDLTAFGIQFADYKFQIEAQYFAKETPVNPGAYRFRLPRLSAGIRSIRVKDIRILINRGHDPLANAFTFINQVTSPQLPGTRGMVYPLLSSDTVITNQLTPEDKLSISFDVFEKATPVECKAPEYFQENIVPYFQQAMCAKCHGKGEGASFQVFASTGDNKNLCRSVRERINLNHPMQSSFLKLVTQGKFQHPQVVTNPELFTEDFLKWIEKEL